MEIVSNKMSQLIVLSAVGTDRSGVVKDLSKAILDCGGNIEESRMTSLGAEFAVLMLISGNWHTPTKLEKSLEALSKEHNLSINLKKNRRSFRSSGLRPLWRRCCLPRPGGHRISSFGVLRQQEHRDIRFADPQLFRTAHRCTDVFCTDGSQHSGIGSDRPVKRRFS